MPTELEGSLTVWFDIQGANPNPNRDLPEINIMSVYSVTWVIINKKSFTVPIFARLYPRRLSLVHPRQWLAPHLANPAAACARDVPLVIMIIPNIRVYYYLLQKQQNLVLALSIPPHVHFCVTSLLQRYDHLSDSSNSTPGTPTFNLLACRRGSGQRCDLPPPYPNN